MEVFPQQRRLGVRGINFLHVCGGVSLVFDCFLKRTVIFSTYVEVFLMSRRRRVSRRDFLHVCGGVSTEVRMLGTCLRFSPRMWRCFHTKHSLTSRTSIFSTYVEVFLTEGTWGGKREDFLHVCGGVSLSETTASYLLKFSPRMWRCF